MAYSTRYHYLTSTWVPTVARAATGTKGSQKINSTWKFWLGMGRVSGQRTNLQPRGRVRLCVNASLDICQAIEKYGWKISSERKDWNDDPQVQELPVKAIRRPLQGSRSNGKIVFDYKEEFDTLIVSAFTVLSILVPNAYGLLVVDQEKVNVLKQSIDEIGLLEPIDVLLVDGVYYGFSGCHRFQAHQELGKETILCRVRKATKQTLKMHLM